MKPLKTVRIVGLSHKFKNYVRDWGDVWNVMATRQKDGKVQFSITPASHARKEFPYQAWVTDGQQIRAVEEIKNEQDNH